MLYDSGASEFLVARLDVLTFQVLQKRNGSRLWQNHGAIKISQSVFGESKKVLYRVGYVIILFDVRDGIGKDHGSDLFVNGLVG